LEALVVKLKECIICHESVMAKPEDNFPCCLTHSRLDVIKALDNLILEAEEKRRKYLWRGMI
jgi:hypothetical protein